MGAREHKAGARALMRFGFGGRNILGTLLAATLLYEVKQLLAYNPCVLARTLLWQMRQAEVTKVWERSCLIPIRRSLYVNSDPAHAWRSARGGGLSPRQTLKGGMHTQQSPNEPLVGSPQSRHGYYQKIPSPM